MDNEDEFWEQPQDLVLDEESEKKIATELEGSQNEPTLQEGKADESEAEKGVPVGKFKSVEALYDAYNNLQREFTKKCQRLAEVEKDKTSDEISEEALEEKYRKFLNFNGEASAYGEELKRRVAENGLSKMDNPFEYAWAEMLFEKLKSPNSDEPVLNSYILKNEKINDAVLKNYLNQLNENKSPVKLSSSSGNRVATSVTLKPSSLEEAKKAVYDLFS